MLCIILHCLKLHLLSLSNMDICKLNYCLTATSGCLCRVSTMFHFSEETLLTNHAGVVE